MRAPERWRSDESEHDAERIALGLRQAVQPVEERRTQLLNRSEREFHLRLDSGRPGDPELARGLNRTFEQRRFADAASPCITRTAPRPPRMPSSTARSRSRPTNCPPDERTVAACPLASAKHG
jgi:hypothetical protein